MEKIIETDKILNFMDLDTTSFKEGILTYKSLYLTLWAKDRLGLDPSLEPIPLKPFKDFFIDLFTGEEKGKIDTIKKEDFILWLSRFTEKNDHIISDYFLSVAKDLFEELENEYAFIEPEHIDPRFFPHFLLTK